MTEVKSIQNTKEVIALVLAGVKCVQSAQADGKIDAADLGQLLALIPAIGPAVSDIGQVPAELGDLSSEELAELTSFVLASQGISDHAQAKAYVSGGLKIVAGVLEILKARA